MYQLPRAVQSVRMRLLESWKRRALVNLARPPSVSSMVLIQSLALETLRFSTSWKGESQGSTCRTPGGMSAVSAEVLACSQMCPPRSWEESVPGTACPASSRSVLEAASAMVESSVCNKQKPGRMQLDEAMGTATRLMPRMSFLGEQFVHGDKSKQTGGRGIDQDQYSAGRAGETDAAMGLLLLCAALAQKTLSVGCDAEEPRMVA